MILELILKEYSIYKSATLLFLLEMKPSFDTAKKLANTVKVSLDYLVGEEETNVLNKKTLKRLNDIEALPEQDKNHIFYALDLSLIHI